MEPITLFALAMGLILALWLCSLPGRIARSKHHPNAEAIALCGWLSLILWPLWFVAIIWAATAAPAPLMVRSYPKAKSLNYNPDDDVTLPDGPGHYKVSGVDRATKMDTSWQVDADSEANARAKGELEGIMVTKVERIS